MRLRADSVHLAGWHRALLLGALTRKDGEDWSHTLGVPAAQPGDVWRVQRQDDSGGLHFVGYALTCPKEDCDQGVHFWDHAWDCPQRTDPLAPPCWTWTGSPEAGDLTANPSLHVLAEKGGCGWHGWLRNGEMVLA